MSNGCEINKGRTERADSAYMNNDDMDSACPCVAGAALIGVVVACCSLNPGLAKARATCDRHYSSGLHNTRQTWHWRLETGEVLAEALKSRTLASWASGGRSLRQAAAKRAASPQASACGSAVGEPKPRPRAGTGSPFPSPLTRCLGKWHGPEGSATGSGVAVYIHGGAWFMGSTHHPSPAARVRAGVCQPEVRALSIERSARAGAPVPRGVG